MYNRLSEQARRGIARKVWAIWLLRKTTLPALIVLLAALETTLISAGAVFSGALHSARSPRGFWNFWVSAVTNAEATVLLVSGILVVLGVILTWRICLSGITSVVSLMRRRVT